LKGEAVNLVFEDQRHCCNLFAFIFLMTGLRDAGRLMRATKASIRSRRANSRRASDFL